MSTVTSAAEVVSPPVRVTVKGRATTWRTGTVTSTVSWSRVMFFREAGLLPGPIRTTLAVSVMVSLTSLPPMVARA